MGYGLLAVVALIDNPACAQEPAATSILCRIVTIEDSSGNDTVTRRKM